MLLEWCNKDNNQHSFYCKCSRFVPENKKKCNFSCGFAWIGMWGIFRQLYDVWILNFQPNSWPTLAIPCVYLPYIFNIPSIYLECSFLLPSFFLLSSYLLPTHYSVFTKGIFSVVIVRYESSMSQELSIFNFQLSQLWIVFWILPKILTLLWLDSAAGLLPSFPSGTSKPLLA